MDSHLILTARSYPGISFPFKRIVPSRLWDERIRHRPITVPFKKFHIITSLESFLSPCSILRVQYYSVMSFLYLALGTGNRCLHTLSSIPVDTLSFPFQRLVRYLSIGNVS